MAVFTSYDAFAASTVGTQVGNGTNKAYINLLWNYLGSVYYTSSPSGPDPTGQGVKYGWTNTDARSANTITHLTQITSPSQIAKGDVVIIDDGVNGHAGFADEDYNGSYVLRMCSQNYSSAYVTREDVDISGFLGGWRYDAWYTPPTPPTPPGPAGGKRGRFPWVLYARKLRERR